MIVVDDRKDEVRLFDILANMPDLMGEVFKAHLKSGDIQIHGFEDRVVGIERKTVSDFISSFRSGRLQAVQFPNMAEEYAAIYLLLEGRFRSSRSGGVDVFNGKRWVEEPPGTENLTYGAMVQVLNSFSVCSGVFVVRTECFEETADAIRALHYWWGRKDHKSWTGFYRAVEKYASILPPSLVKRIAKELPMVGWDRSCAIADEFKTVKEMVLAEEKRWTKIAGIGKVLARKIVTAIEGKGEAE